MSHPTDQGGPSEQGWSGSDDDTVSPTKGGPAGYADEQAYPLYGQDPYPSYGQGPHQQVGESAPYGPPAPAGWPPPTNTKAIIALCTVFGMPILGIVFGVMARREIDRTGEGGRAYATWGLGLGIAAVVFWALYLLAVVGFFFAAVAGGLAGTGSGF